MAIEFSAVGSSSRRGGDGGEHVKKLRRKRQREKNSSSNGTNSIDLGIGSGLNPDGSPIASTSKAVYVPPSDLVERYKRGGNPVTSSSKNKKLQTHLNSLTRQQKASAAAAYEHDSLLLPQDASSRLQAETDLERTWKVSQSDIRQSIGASTAQKSFSLDLPDFGPYRASYSTDGRQLVLGGRRGHLATFDWQTGKLGTEVHVKETLRDVCWLHNTSFFAAAQKKYVYIYDSNGLEIHQLQSHLEVTRMEFLKYHFLLATVGNAGYLKYQDTSTGQLVAEHRTRLGACQTMAQNHHTGVIGLGHSNGTVSLWTPNISTAQVKLLAHRGPVTAVSYDPSSIGTYFSTAGLDGTMKVWDSRTWAVVNEWALPKPAASLHYSQKGLLAAGWGNHATVYADTSKFGSRAPGPYMSHVFNSSATQSVAFCPFEDILGVGHAQGFSSLIIPGAGEANYDALEADPFESKRSRREREVVSLLDKLQPDQIHLDADFIGKLAGRTANPSASDNALALPGKGRPTKDYNQLSRVERLAADETGEDSSDVENDSEAAATSRPTEAGAVKKPRGRNKVLKRVLRRKKNIIDEKTMRARDLIEQRRAQAVAQRKESRKTAIRDNDDALGRFLI